VQAVDFSWPLGATLRYHCSRQAFRFISLSTDWFSEHKDPFDVYIYYDGLVSRNPYDPAKEVTHAIEKDTMASFGDAHLFVFRSSNKKAD
jgi:hypothetical protein